MAEIYILGRSTLFPGAPGPEIVRLLGCRYHLYRGSPAWAELEQALAEADFRVAPTAAIGEVRIALILGDRAGIAWEAYAEDPYPAQSVVRGFSQRRRVEISPSFAATLKAFANRHGDLQVADGSRRVCS